MEIIFCHIPLDHISTIYTTYKLWICVFFTHVASSLLPASEWESLCCFPEQEAVYLLTPHFYFLHTGFAEAMDNDRTRNTNLMLNTALTA